MCCTRLSPVDVHMSMYVHVHVGVFELRPMEYTAGDDDADMDDDPILEGAMYILCTHVHVTVDLHERTCKYSLLHCNCTALVHVHVYVSELHSSFIFVCADDNTGISWI